MSKANGWTPARRKAQSERIRQWQPWVQSTGPKTAAGKAAASQNASKGQWRKKLRGLAKLMQEAKQEMAKIR